MGDLGQKSFEHEAPVVIVGGGPVGMLTAFELSRLGIECLLAEQSLETTKWPKMDLTNCRSMEIMRMMGIADEYRAQKGAVNGSIPSDSLFYTSCSPEGKLITAWVRDSIVKMGAELTGISATATNARMARCNC
jgi:thioredoxin reductase